MDLLVRNGPGLYVEGGVFFVVWVGWSEMGWKKVGRSRVAGESEASCRG